MLGRMEVAPGYLSVLREVCGKAEPPVIGGSQTF